MQRPSKAEVEAAAAQQLRAFQDVRVMAVGGALAGAMGGRALRGGAVGMLLGCVAGGAAAVWALSLQQR